MTKNIFFICLSLLFSLSMKAQDAITVLSPKTIIENGSMVSYDVKYTKTINEDAYVLIRFQESNGSNLPKFAIKKVSANTGTVTLKVEAPKVNKSNYRLQAQLLRVNDYGGLKNYIKTGIIVRNSTPSNTIQVINPKTIIENGSMVSYNVKYTKTINEDAFVLIRFQESNESNLPKFGIKRVSANTGTVTLKVEAPKVNKSNYRLQAQLLRANDYGGLKNYIKTGIKVVNSSTGDGGAGSGDQNYPPNGGETIAYNPNFTSNNYYQRDLGKGYHTNWFIDPSWLGDISANFGPAETFAWVDFDNQGGLNGHGEIDLKVQKAFWHESKTSTRGYPTEIKSVTNDLNCTVEGSWSPGSSGRAFINMTAWITKDEIWKDSPRCDIIIHTWDNSGDMHEKYAYEEVNKPGSALEVLNQFTTNKGVKYHVLKRNKGGNGEAATYNLLPVINTSNRQDRWDTEFDTTTTNHDIDMRDIINRLYESDRVSKKPTFNRNWWIQVLEWTVVPSGGDTVAGDPIGNAKGRFNFHNYTIPNLTGPPLDRDSNTLTEKDDTQGISVHPNPFKGSFTYTYGNENVKPVRAELYSLDNKNVNIINSTNSTSSGNSTTVSTSSLSKGVYVLRIFSNDKVIIKKIVKD